MISLKKTSLCLSKLNYGVYFQRLFPVTLFLFASSSIVLNAMQVILTGSQIRREREWGGGKGVKKISGV